MKIFKSLLKKVLIDREIDEVEVHMVEWISRYGGYSHNTKKEFRAFLSKDAAKDFAKSLKEANALLKNKEALLEVAITYGTKE